MPEQSIIPIDRAKQDIRDVNAAIGAFRERYPCRVVVQRDAKAERIARPHVAVFVAKNETFDGKLRPLVRAAFMNLSTALDGALRAKVLEQGGDPNGVAFPIIDREGDAQTAIASANVKRAGPNVLQFIYGLQAHPRGEGEALWAACRVAVNVHHQVEGPSLTHLATVRGLKRATGVKLPDIVRQPCRDGAQLAGPLSEEHFEVNQNIEAEIAIALSGGEAFEGVPVLEALSDCATKVSRVLDAIRDL